MKIKLLPAACALLLQQTHSHAATVIISDDFSGLSTADIHGTTADTGGGRWTGTPNFNADGSIASGGGAATVPFVPAAGNLYTFSATIAFTSNDANWIGMGFADDNGAGWSTSATQLAAGNATRFTGAIITGYSWMITAPNATAGLSAFRGPAAGATIVTETGMDVFNASTITLTITLDTSAANWKTDYFVNNTPFATYTHAGTHPIDSVGFSSTSIAAGKVSNFQLTVEPIPEPGAALLGGMGLLGFLRRRKN